MTKLTRDDVLKLARLARLDLTDDEVAEYATELSAILQYVEQLQTVDVTGLKPTNQVTGLTNVTRPDELRTSLSQEEALKNAPAKANGLFLVPKIVE